MTKSPQKKSAAKTKTKGPTIRAESGSFNPSVMSERLYPPPEPWSHFVTAFADIQNQLEGLCDDGPMGLSVDSDFDSNEENEEVAEFLRGNGSIETQFDLCDPGTSYFDMDEFQDTVEDTLRAALMQHFPSRKLLDRREVEGFSPKRPTPIMVMRTGYTSIDLEFYTATLPALPAPKVPVQKLTPKKPPSKKPPPKKKAKSKARRGAS
jgi:hypothetical protein